jgi:hypothetical protein
MNYHITSISENIIYYWFNLEIWFLTVTFLIHEIVCRATEKKNFEMVKWLLDEEANPNMIADNGYAPIHRACEAGCIDIIQHFQQVYKNLLYNICRYCESTFLRGYQYSWFG